MTKKRREPAARAAPSGRRPPARRGGAPVWLLPVIVAAATVAVLALAAALLAQRGGSSQSGPSPSPSAVQSVTGQASGQTVNGIRCDTSEQVLFHVHAHLAIFANGQERQVPLGIGIPHAQVQQSAGGSFAGGGSCFYWLHSHTNDGVIHIEAPVQRTFTLGDWFDIWGQPLSASEAGSDTGTVIAYVDGRRFNGDPRSIPLNAHTAVQLDVGTDVPFRQYTFPQGL